MVVEWITLTVAVVAALAEWIHRRRVRRVAHLAFGPRGRPALWTRLAPLAARRGAIGDDLGFSFPVAGRRIPNPRG